MKKISFLILAQMFLCSIITAQVVDVDGIIFNEVNYDVTVNNGGQWNGTGTTEGTLEFIEFYNSSTSSVDIASWIIADANSFRFQFNINSRIIAAGFLTIIQPVYQIQS